MFTRRALAVLAILAASAMAQDACPAGIALLFKGTPESPRAGKSLRLAYTLVNKGTKAITSSAVAISLDDHVTYSSSSSKPAGSTGTHANGVVTWASAGSVAVGRSKTYTVETMVASGAQLLTFDAGAEVTLSDGTTCVVEALRSVLRVKGFKQVVPDEPKPIQKHVPVASSLVAPTTGYAEKVLFSAEGIEVVHLCFLGQNAPAEVPNTNGYTSGTTYTMLVGRASSLTQPTVTPVGEWFGYTNNNNPSSSGYWQISNFNLASDWIQGDRQSATNYLGMNLDWYFALMNQNGGALILNGYYGGAQMVGKYLSTDTFNSCHAVASISYTPSGTVYPVIPY